MIGFRDKKKKIDYVCGDCGRRNCKLWREYQTFLDRQHLRCGQCALENQKDSPTVKDSGQIIDDSGYRLSKIYIFNRETQSGYEVNGQFGREPTQEELENGYIHFERSCEIGWLVPAILTEEEDTFWGYTSCPTDRILWWTRLPT